MSGFRPVSNWPQKRQAFAFRADDCRIHTHVCPQVSGSIKRIKDGTILDSCTGNWLTHLEWETGAGSKRVKRIWDSQRTPLFPAQPLEDALTSDCRHREDVVQLKVHTPWCMPCVCHVYAAATRISPCSSAGMHLGYVVLACECMCVIAIAVVWPVPLHGQCIACIPCTAHGLSTWLVEMMLLQPVLLLLLGHRSPYRVVADHIIVCMCALPCCVPLTGGRSDHSTALEACVGGAAAQGPQAAEGRRRLRALSQHR